MSWPGCCFSLDTSSATSPLIRLAFHSASCSVLEATYLGRLFILSANPTSSVMEGQTAANSWYVTRPSSRAPLANSSSNLYFPISSCQNGGCHSPGASMTPSRVTNSETITLLTLTLLILVLKQHFRLLGCRILLRLHWRQLGPLLPGAESWRGVAGTRARQQ